MNAYTMTTALMVAFALFVVFTRFKNWLQSNIPLFFYVILIFYMRSVDGNVPFWLIVTGMALGLMLRFEFMNQRFTSMVKLLELGALGAIIYLSVEMILA